VLLGNELDPQVRAQRANAVRAEVYVSLAFRPEGDGVATAYFAAHGHSSPGGKRLASLIHGRMVKALDVEDCGYRGMRLPELVTTRMPAVRCEMAPATLVVERGAQVAQVISEALSAWVRAPIDPR
jgi:N-acetylmuramoyl-L-alanine amidase